MDTAKEVMFSLMVSLLNGGKSAGMYDVVFLFSAF